MVKKKTASQEKLRLTKIPVQAYLDPEQSEALKVLSAQTRVPQQAYIREGVEYVLAKYKMKAQKRVPK